MENAAPNQHFIDGYEAGLQISNSVNDVWLYELLGGAKADSGVSVNYRTALTLAYVWSAQQIIAGDVASLPFETKRLEADGDLASDMSTDAYALMNFDANRNMTAYSLRETLTHHALMEGNGMAYIYRERARPVELIPAIRGALKPTINANGVLVYVDHANDDVWSQWDILHIKGLGDDGVSGLSWLQVAKNSVGLGLAENRHGSRHFAKGAKPSIVLKHPSMLDKQKADQLLEAWEERHGNDVRPALAAGGLEVEVLPIKNSDAQWLESRKFTRQEVAAWFNLPPHKIGDTERAAYNTLLAENQAYVTQTLRRWLKRWESEVNRKLIPQRQRTSYVCMHDAKPLTDTDIGEITDQVTKQVGSMVITINEARRRLGYPRIEGGDVLLNPNTTSGNQPTEEAEEPPETGTTETRAALVSALTDRLETLVNALGQQCKRKSNKGDDLTAEWVQSWQDKAEQYAAPTLAVASTIYKTSGVDEVRQAAERWANSLWNGSEAIPTPADLADQLIGA